jgi:hypothetical protein
VSQLVVMGSGETAPTMVKVHRQVIQATTGIGPSVLLDTPFGFQLNADDLVDKTLGYFADSVGSRVEVGRWRRSDASVTEQEHTLALLSRASWVFAGPGSPTYALRQWHRTAIPDALLDVVRRGGTLVMGSAAACTLGTHAIPVYEIYKVGEDPRWVPGLDLFGALTGIEAAIVPHFDNNEGGATYDSRYCYLGEPRLAALEVELPDDIGVLGIDEHTALVIDLDTRTATVVGNGTVTVRRRGVSHPIPAGRELGLDLLGSMLRGGDAAADDDPTIQGPPDPVAAVAASNGARSGSAHPQPSLGAEADAAQARFESGLAARDVDACVTAVLDLESAIVAWSADTDQNADTDRARRVLRALVVRLGQLAEVGARDPHDLVRPYVELALQLRQRARSSKDFVASDLIRDELAAAGVEVRDTSDGATWALL